MKYLFGFTTKKGLNLRVFDEYGDLYVERVDSVKCPGGNRIVARPYVVTKEVEYWYKKIVVEKKKAVLTVTMDASGKSVTTVDWF